MPSSACGRLLPPAWSAARFNAAMAASGWPSARCSKACVRWAMKKSGAISKARCRRARGFTLAAGRWPLAAGEQITGLQRVEKRRHRVELARQAQMA